MEKDFKMIVAYDLNRGIGLKGTLPWSYFKEDMKRFRDLTMGHNIIMGRNTFLSLPNSSPLKGRRNIVLSSTLSHRDDIVIYKSFDDLIISESTSWIIGGNSIYNLFKDICSEIHVTEIHNVYDCDTYFPFDIDLNIFEKEIIYSCIDYSFVKYIRNI